LQSSIESSRIQRLRDRYAENSGDWQNPKPEP
jgi:hypothetical protein